MKVNAYLFIDKSGNFRITKKDNGIKPSELAIKLEINVPDAFFKRPIPKCEINIPSEYIYDPDTEFTANMVAAEIADPLGLDVVEVRDGLVKMLDARLQEKKSSKNVVKV